MSRASLAFGDDHQLAQRSARDFVAKRSSLKRVHDGDAFSPALWREMAGLGWLGLTLPEDHGGAGADHLTEMLVLGELGRGLVPEPVVPAIFAMAVLRGAGAPVAEIAAGTHLVAVAWQEQGTRFAADRAQTRVEDGRLFGDKTLVLGGMSAHAFVVSTHDGLYLVEAGATVRERQHLLDGRDAALVHLVGAPGEKLPGDLQPAIDRATIALCAEMLGATDAAFAMTLDYLKTRQQFGVPIGSFQALQHRAAKLYVEIELCRSAVMRAHVTLDAESDPQAIARAASVAKAKCSDVFMQVAHEGVQMHGGIGMTDEHDIGLYLKRARVAEMTFGDGAFHRARFARLAGF